MDEGLTRKECLVGRLVYGGRHKHATLYKVVDDRACDHTGALQKRGRYVAVRAWDEVTGDFKEGAVRRGAKPADLLSVQKWQEIQRRDKERLAERDRQIHEFHKRAKPVADEVQQTFADMGLGDMLRVMHVRDSHDVQFIESLGFQRWGVTLNNGYADVTLNVLAEFGVIPAWPKREG